jgi:methionyl-tRNA synthetase
MRKIEEQNSLSAVEAATTSATCGAATTCGGANSGSATKAEAAGLAPAAKIAGKGAIMSEISEKQKSWENAPVDSVGEDAADEALAYETVALSAAPAAAPAASVPATPAELAPPQVAQVGQVTQVTIDDFAKVELRVAQILVAERIPKADKLLRLEVDLGYEKRQILAGIAQYYEPEKLIGRKIVIVANLAPRKMRGLESNGMLLAASLPDGAPVLAGFLEEVPLGARLK